MTVELLSRCTGHARRKRGESPERLLQRVTHLYCTEKGIQSIVSEGNGPASAGYWPHGSRHTAWRRHEGAVWLPASACAYRMGQGQDMDSVCWLQNCLKTATSRRCLQHFFWLTDPLPQSTTVIAPTLVYSYMYIDLYMYTACFGTCSSVAMVAYM